MPLFHYKGRNLKGQLIEGELNALSTDALMDSLKEQGIIPIDIAAAKLKIRPFAFLQKTITIGSIKIDDLITFCRQMYSMTKAGIPLINTLTLIFETTRSAPLKVSLRAILDDLTGGQPLSQAMKKHPRVFSPLFISLIEAGENTGQLDVIFLQLSEYLELMDRTKKQIKSATRYPVFVITAIFVAMLIVNFFVIPNFAQVFATFNIALPLPTRLLLGSSHFLIVNWPILLLSIVSLIVILRIYLNTPKGRYLWDRWKLQIPIFGSVIYRILLGRFTRSFSMILHTGIPLRQGIELVANITDNEYMRQRILTMIEGIERGETLTVTASQTQLFSPLVLQMFSTGEETGALDRLLREAAEFYEREVEYDLRRLSDLIEPILLVALGFMVLILALGIFLPMWDMVQFVRG